MVRGWKNACCANLCRRKGGDTVDQLPEKHIAHLLLLGQDVEESAKKIIHCIREADDVINNSIGPTQIDSSVARRLLMRMQYVNRTETTKAEVMPSDFQLLQTLLLR